MQLTFAQAVAKSNIVYQNNLQLLHYARDKLMKNFFYEPGRSF